MSQLQKIAVADLRLGMYLNKFDGSWLQNPFWKMGFVLAHPADLRKAQQSGLQHCWIDPAQGIAAPEQAADVSAPVPAREPTPEPASPAPPRPPAGLASFDESMSHARSICSAARGATMAMFNEARLGNAIDTEACLPLIADITESISSHSDALISLVRLKASDDYTYMHSVAVCALMVALAKTLGLDEATCRNAGMAGLLHDIGKSCLPLEVLNKPGKLTDAEYATVRDHPLRGHQLLLKGKFANAAVLDVCLHHHEKFDGTGYPDRLRGEEISLLSRMGAVCDVYDAITSNRPYKSGWDPAESVAKMLSWAGHFDEKVLTAFIKTVGIYPTGSLVRLRSGRIAVVVEQHPTALTRPVIKAFFSEQSNTHIPTERIDLARPGETEMIVGRATRGHWDAANIDRIWAGG